MDFTLLDLLKFLGALALFIFGMKVMSEGIQRISGVRLRYFLRRMTSSPFAGVFTGFSTTALIQSSSATTVMLVSFVNAGVLTLKQAIGVIMGANIGTTITAILIFLLGFTKFSITGYSLPILALAFPLTFSSNDKHRAWGEALIGFSILFLGLNILKEAFLPLGPETISTIHELTEMGFLSVILFLCFGLIMTFLVQSSAASIVLTITFCINGLIPFDMAAAMVLGMNVGTTFTATQAAVEANIHAKRTALIHLIFNVIGVIVALLFFYPFLQLIANWIGGFAISDPAPGNIHMTWGLTIFHFLFNLFTTILLIGFVDRLVKAIVYFVPPKGVAEERKRLEYIDTGLLATPELSLLEAKKEISKFGEITKKMGEFVRNLIYEHDQSKQQELLKNIRKYEEITDRIEMEVADYLSKISEDELTKDSSVRIRGMLSNINDLERIGDFFYQMSNHLERKVRERIWFTQDQREGLSDMFDLLDEAFDIMLANLNKDPEEVDLKAALNKEEEINKKKEELRVSHHENIERQEDYNIKSGLIYHDLFSSAEKIGDHILNVSEGLTGKI